jgi:hypothetical protein
VLTIKHSVDWSNRLAAFHRKLLRQLAKNSRSVILWLVGVCEETQMAHEYEVDAESGSQGQQQTHKVVVPDHHHHEVLKDTALFFSILANAIGLPREVIKTARWIRRH